MRQAVCERHVCVRLVCVVCVGSVGSVGGLGDERKKRERREMMFARLDERKNITSMKHRLVLC